MKKIEEQVFEQELENFYEFMIDRFENGFRYLEGNPDNKKAVAEYESIIAKLKVIEELRILLKKDEELEFSRKLVTVKK